MSDELPSVDDLQLAIVMLGATAAQAGQQADRVNLNNEAAAIDAKGLCAQRDALQRVLLWLDKVAKEREAGDE